MMHLQEQPLKRETLNIRIKSEERDLIDQAAHAKGQNRTDFILNAARQAAEDTLLDRVLFSVDAKTYTKFLTRLDADPKPNKRLRHTMQSKTPWDKR